MKKVLIGCAVFVALLLVVGIGGSVYVVQKIKNSFPDMEGLESVERELKLRDGQFESEVMPLDGSIPSEMLENYAEYRRALSRRIEDAAFSLQQLMDEETENKGGFSKLRTFVRGGLDVARASVVISGVADSLLLANDLSRGEAVYMTALVRYGATDFKPPYGSAEDFRGEANEGKRKMLEVIEEFDEQFERRAFVLLETQQRELAEIVSPDARQTAWMATVDFVVNERPRRISNLNGQLQEWQIDALAPRLDELRASWPQTPAEYFLDLLPLMDQEDDKDGVEISFD